MIINLKNKLIEAKHGDGYLSSNSVTVREDVETVNCTIYGGPSFNATWKRYFKLFIFQFRHTLNKISE